MYKWVGKVCGYGVLCNDRVKVLQCDPSLEESWWCMADQATVSSVRLQQISRDSVIETAITHTHTHTHTHVPSWGLCELPCALVFILLTGLVETKAACQQPKREVPLSTETPAVSPNAEAVLCSSSHPSSWAQGWSHTLVQQCICLNAVLI